MAQVKGITTSGGSGTYYRNVNGLADIGVAARNMADQAAKLAYNTAARVPHSASGSSTDDKNGNGSGSGSGSGSSSRKGSSSSSGAVADNNTIDYESLYLAQLEAEREEARRREEEARRRAEEAYNRNMQSIATAYNSASGNLKDNYSSTVDRLNVARDNSMNDVNTDAEKSLREAYINNMLNRRNLNQRLSAMGYNGGATESTMASLENQYGSSRSGINETLNKNISNLDTTYGDNLAAALQQYNSAKSNLDMQRMQLENAALNARNNLEASYMNSPNISVDSNYLTALKNVLAKQNAYNYNNTAATNSYNPGTAMQAQTGATGNNYAKYLAQAQLEAQQGNSQAAIKESLFKAMDGGELTISEVANILSSTGMV